MVMSDKIISPRPIAPALASAQAPWPLADRIRPQVLDDVAGQEHLLGPDGALRRMIATGSLSSLIF